MGEAWLAGLTTVISSTVGVGISITTIPAAAYLGVAAGKGQLEKVCGALAVPPPPPAPARRKIISFGRCPGEDRG